MQQLLFACNRQQQERGGRTSMSVKLGSVYEPLVAPQLSPQVDLARSNTTEALCKEGGFGKPEQSET